MKLKKQSTQSRRKARDFELQDTMATKEYTPDLLELLSSNGADMLIRNNNEEVPVTELKNRIVGLYFSKNSDENCQRFNPLLIKTYNDLREMGKDFEVILISEDNLSETQFRLSFSTMPWLALPLGQMAHMKILVPNAIGIIERHGSSAYPFNSEKLTQLDGQLREAQPSDYLFGDFVRDCGRAERLSSRGTMANNENAHGLSELLSSKHFLIRNYIEEVKMSAIVGKVVGLYFGSCWLPSSQSFICRLTQLYEELGPNGTNQFEVVYICSDNDIGTFIKYAWKMPWPMIPFSDSETRMSLMTKFKCCTFPKLVILDGDGKVMMDDATDIVWEHGAAGFPFTPSRIRFLESLETEVVYSMGSSIRLISNDGKQVQVSNLKNKTVAMYFWRKSDKHCAYFHTFLLTTYEELKKEEIFDVVLIPQGQPNIQYDEEFSEMPWLALPDEDVAEKAIQHFKIVNFPGLVIIGPNGKTLISDAIDTILEHGSKAFPFTRSRIGELAVISEAEHEKQTLESLLIDGDKDFLLGICGTIVPVSSLVGRCIFLYFSAEYITDSQAFLQKFIGLYFDFQEIGGNTRPPMEVIYISCDEKSTFEYYFEKMPWLAIPHGDKRREMLLKWFKVKTFPRVIMIGASGRTVDYDTANKIMGFDSQAFYDWCVFGLGL
ncbi:hypothetical protein FNV43_RR26060 [Rhamnella rubrinervis]|uniref:protein-disulfide reductase n=1 Tax=Rhamnella rubrinervis TaxID=2594499 RepID=A0A8K0DNK3_9ROSA|nr:hypothetical protein FNV43_RR26060 [Rhamnella rubrinervis]